MSDRMDIENSKRSRRWDRCDRAFLDGYHATTEYCSIRKRKYRAAWLRGLALRKGRLTVKTTRRMVIYRIEGAIVE